MAFRTIHLAPFYLFAFVLSGQQYAISTFAGGSPPALPAAATAVSVGLTGGVAVDSADNVFFSGRNCVFRLDRKGGLTRVAGNSRAGYSGDGGPAVNAQLTSPNTLAVDHAGNLYLTDNYRVRKVSAAGIITTVAGNGTPGNTGDGGAAIAAQITYQNAIAADDAGNIYLGDYFNGVRMVSRAGIITTVVAGAQLNGPEALAVDPAGNLFIADSSNYRVVKVSAQGGLTTVAGTGVFGSSGDGGPAANAQITRPDAITFDRYGNLYIAASSDFRLRKVSPSGIISTLYAGDSVPGTEGAAIGLGVDSAGNAYLSDSYRYRIRKISPDGIVSTAAGNGVFAFSGDGGPAFRAELFGPQAVAFDGTGNLYIADTYNHRIRRVTPAGAITTVAGTGAYGDSGDGGPALQASFLNPWALATDQNGNLYIADASNSRIRRVSPDGLISTVAGGSTSGYSGDGGPAVGAQLNAPTALTVDSLGNLYIADSINQCIRKVSTAGTMTTVAFTPGVQLVDPSAITVDRAGNLYIIDQAGFGRVNRVSTQGVFTTLTGADDMGGPPRTRQHTYPNGIAVDPAGNVYFTDSYNYRVRKITASGTVTTIAGNQTYGYSGDGGPATLAALFNPVGVAVDAAGNVYVADSYANAIRLLRPIPSSVAISAVTNGATNLPGPLSPGEVVVLYGSMLGPASLTSWSQLNNAGNINTQLAGTSVSFNGTPAPVLYASFTQVAAIVPYELSGTTAQISITAQGQTSAPVSVTLAASAPGLFTLDSSGRGQAAAINQDGSVNSAVFPASPGSVISLYATGEGQLSPAGVNGAPAKNPLPHPVLPVTVIIAGQTLTPEYAGSAPGQVEGLLQINVRIPPEIGAGNAVPVVISIGGSTSSSGVTLAIGPQ